MKSLLLGNIKDLLEIHKALGPMEQEVDPLEIIDSEESNQEDNYETQEEELPPSDPKENKKGKKIKYKTKGYNKQTKNVRAVKKEGKERIKKPDQASNNKNSEDMEMKEKVAKLEAEIKTLTALLRAKVQTAQTNQGQGNPLDGNNQHGNGIGAPNSGGPPNQQTGLGQPGHRNGRSEYTDDSSSEDTRPGMPSFDPFRRLHREDRIQYDRKIEKWNLFFAGDARSISLEDFIFKVKVLASMNGIPNNHLLSNIHLLLRGEASNWFFTYYHPAWTWETFEGSIRFRFGNPNQDQGNRQRIYDRKQQKGETFIAFVTEIERLNKLLTKPLSNRRKFEIVWENMRQHYRSKLACFSIGDLDELIQMNYRIDANDPSLHPVGPKFPVHNLEANEEEESNDDEVNAIGRRPMRNQNQGLTQDRADQTTRGEDRQEVTRVPLCWNCRRNGHFWRDCREQKTTFCYVCGNPGKISSTCDKHPRRVPQNQTGSGN